MGEPLWRGKSRDFDDGITDDISYLPVDHPLVGVPPGTEVEIWATGDVGELRREIWKLFDDWESAEELVFQDRGVGRAEHDQMDAEIEARRQRLIALIGEPAARDSSSTDPGPNQPK